MSEACEGEHNASVLYNRDKVRHAILVLTDPCKMVCAPSLVSIPQSTRLVFLAAAFFCTGLNRTGWDGDNLGRKWEEEKEKEWLARDTNFLMQVVRQGGTVTSSGWSCWSDLSLSAWSRLQPGHTPLEVQVCCWKGQVVPHSKSCEKLNNKDPPSELIYGQWHLF